MIDIQTDTREGTGWKTWKNGHKYMKLFSERFNKIADLVQGEDPEIAAYRASTVGPMMAVDAGFALSNHEASVGLITPVGSSVYYIATLSTLDTSRQFAESLNATGIKEFTDSEFQYGLKYFTQEIKSELSKIPFRPIALPHVQLEFQVMSLNDNEFKQLSPRQRFVYGVAYRTDMLWLNKLVEYSNTYMPQSPATNLNVDMWDRLLFSHYLDFVQKGNASEEKSRVIGKTILYTNADIYDEVYSNLEGEPYTRPGYKKGLKTLKELHYSIADAIEV